MNFQHFDWLIPKNRRRKIARLTWKTDFNNPVLRHLKGILKLNLYFEHLACKLPLALRLICVTVTSPDISIHRQFRYLCSSVHVSSDFFVTTAMNQSSNQNADHFCPHMDAGDLRCNHRFTMATVASAFSVCCNAFHGCATFHRINMEESHGTLEKPVVIRRPIRGAGDGVLPVQVTAHGQNISIRSRGA